MSYVFNRNVYVGGEFSSDMFGRLKTADAFTLFDSAHRYLDNGDYSDSTSGTASTSYNINTSTVSLTVGNADGDSVSRESKRIFPYQPGKSLQVMQTFVMAPAQENLRQRVGYFSRENGIYLEQDDTDVYIVKRTYASGTVSETRVAQANWNRDRLDGTTPSGLDLDLTKAQILVMEFEWLGVGSVRVGFAFDGNFVIAHQFNHANITDGVYMTTASLPVRYEITNTGVTTGSNSLKQICVTVISNGGYTPSAQYDAVKRTTPVSVGTTFYPIVSIRMAAGRTDSVILPIAVDALGLTAGAVYEWELLRNATLTGGSWGNHPNTGNVQTNSTTTAVSGGTRVRGGFFTAADKGAGAPVSLGDINDFELQLGRTNATTPVSDTYTLVARTLTGTGDVVGTMSWIDIL